MIPIFRGNVVRSIVGCSIYMVSMLYLSTWLAPIITNVFKIAHYNVGTSGQVTSVLCGIWPAGLFASCNKIIRKYWISSDWSCRDRITSICK